METRLYGDFHFINYTHDPLKVKTDMVTKYHTKLLDEITQILQDKMELKLKIFEKIPETVKGVVWDGTPEMAKLINRNISDDFYITLINDVWYLKDYTKGSFNQINIGNIISIIYRTPTVLSGKMYREKL